MSSSGGGGGGGSNDWCTIESDPGVFTEMLEELGCGHVELEELWSLDDESLGQLTANGGVVYGLIFLFKWGQEQMGRQRRPPPPPQQQQQQEETKQKTTTKKKKDDGDGDDELKKEDEDEDEDEEEEVPNDLFFAHQVTTNACATQAILSVVLNAGLEESQLGPTLKGFHSFTESFTAALKGEAISSSEEIRKVHNSFARTDAFLQEGKIHNLLDHEKEDVYHFVAYIPHTKTRVVYELDGLQRHPIKVGSYPPSTDNHHHAWLQVAREAIQQRMQIMGGNEIKFNLMAVVQDHRYTLTKHIESIAIQQSQQTEQDDTTTTTNNNNNNNNNNNSSLLESEALAAQQELSVQEAKRQRWKLENQRRRHNYLPLCMEIIKALAKNGNLPKLITEAQQRQAAKVAKKAHAQAQAAAAAK